MAWTLDYELSARRQLRKLSKENGARILNALETIAGSENPRLKGIAMAGRYAGYWRYRVGDYRVIAKVFDQRLVILVVEIGHRREVYR